MDEETLFHLVVGKPAGQRAAFLHEACGGDDALRQRVEVLLAAHQNPATFLESPAGGSKPDLTLDPPILLLPPGTVVGRYKLLEPIGEGGYGVVFMAEQTSPVQRKVALKIIKAGMDTRQVIARFEAERQALALMDHPNIAKVFDAGTTDTGRPYFVMELVKGIPITKYCDEHHIEPRQRLDLFMQVCQAVQHAHQKGIIHRDLKPSNVLVAQYDGKPVPKVIDFGVAKATGHALTELTMFTGFGDVIGTLEYMSPEQAEVNQLDVDTRSDIYSLGVLLYELLTGSTPLEHNRVMKAGLLEMLRLVREEEPPRPSTRLSTSETLPSIAANRGLEPKKLSGLVLGELDWIVMKALEKDRTRRYETANGMASDVRRYLDDEPVQACPPSATYRFRKFARRHKVALATSALLSVVLVLGALISTWQAVRATRAEHRAAAETEKAKTEAAIAQAVNEFLNRDLLGQTNFYIPYDRFKQARSELTLATVLDRAAGQLEGRFADQPLVEAALRQTIGQTYGLLDRDEDCELHVRRTFELRRAHLGDEHPLTLLSMAQLAWATDDPSLVTRVLEIRRRVLGKDHPDTLDSMFNVAMEMKDPARAIELYRETLEAQRRVLGEDDPRTAWTMHCLALTLLGNAGKDGIPAADDREIESMLRHALSATRKALGNSWHTYSVIQGLGHFLNARHRYEEAESLLKDALAQLSAMPAAPPNIVASQRNELRSVYLNWGKPERAAELDRQQAAETESALARNARLLSDRHEDPELLFSYGSLLLHLQRYGEAEAAYRGSIALNPQNSEAHHWLGDACAAQHRYPQAESAYREAIRLAPNDGSHHHNLGDAFLHQGKLTDAAVEFTEAIRLKPNEQGPHYGLGSAYAYGGQWDKAKVEFHRATELSPDDMWSVYRWASLCLYTNDMENYRRACRAMMDHFSQTENVTNADCTAKACALVSGFAGDEKQVAKLVEVSAASKDEFQRKWIDVTNGLVSYRAGRFGPATEMVTRSGSLSEESHRAAQAFSILAMAQHRLGNVEEAHIALTNAQRIVSTKMPKIEKGEIFGDDWHDWLQAQMLCREAEQVLKAHAAVTQQSK